MLVLFGGQASTELAHQKLIANCASALEPSQELLSSITTFLTGLDENRAEHFRAIMTTQRSAQYMTRFMLEQNMTLDKVEDAEQVLEYLENQWKETLRAESQEEIERIKHEYEETIKSEQENAAKVTQEKNDITKALEEHQSESAAKIKNNELEILELRKNLEKIQKETIDSNQRDLEIAKSSIQTMLREADEESHKSLATWARLALIICIPLVGAATYLAFSPNSMWLKILIIALATLATVISSTWAGRKVETWKKAKIRSRFFSEVSKDFFIQRHIDFLKIDYDKKEVLIVTPDDKIPPIYIED